MKEIRLKKKKEELRMREESVEKLARERAEESAKKEALTTQLAVYTPFILLACIMAATRVSTVLYTVVVLLGLFVSVAIYLSVKPYAYEKYYRKYLEEFTVLRGDDEG